MPSKPLELIREIEWAYLAGMIDGEGSITITEHRRADRPGYMRRNLRVQIYGTDPRLMVWLQSHFGGRTYSTREHQENRKAQLSIVWAESQIEPILLGALPYLVIKAEQAEIALAYQSLKLPASAGRRKGHSEQALKTMENLWSRLRVLNKRGKSAVENSEAG